MPRILRGRCECRATAYAVEDDVLYALNCHCSNCRASTGAAFKPFVAVARDKLVVTQGGDSLLVWGEPDGNTTRCGICGSLLFSVVDENRIHVALGSLVDEPSLKPTAHIFVGSKAPWHEILDDLPQHEELE